MIRVLVVDDSALMRKLITEILEQDRGIEAVEPACDPYDAWQKLKSFQPDVVTLDVEMPRMDGLTFLAKLMRAKPLPVLMVSSLTERVSQTMLRALQFGAIDYVETPRIDTRSGKIVGANELVDKVKVAASAKLQPRRPDDFSCNAKPPRPAEGSLDANKIVAMGASTGGTEAIAEVLTDLPANSPGIVVAQHMPARFMPGFAKRLDRESRLAVRLAKDGDEVVGGQVLLAPGDLHTEIRRVGKKFFVRALNGPPVNRFRPSVDVLFNSMARQAAEKSVGVILTGMGRDGAQGLLAMRQAGAPTIAQNEGSSVVFGMPKEAIALGAAEQVLPLNRIAESLLAAVSEPACI
jgi:two-component system chemotaxis response regulator CheB